MKVHKAQVRVCLLEASSLLGIIVCKLSVKEESQTAVRPLPVPRGINHTKTRKIFSSRSDVAKTHPEIHPRNELPDIFTSSHLSCSSLQFAENVGEDDHTCLPEDLNALQQCEWQLPNSEQAFHGLCHDEPDRQEGYSKEVVDEDNRLANDSRKQTDRTIDTVSSLLKVREAPLL